MSIKRKKTRKSNGFFTDLNKHAIRRLARRGGCKRISGFVYDDARHVLKDFLTETFRKIVPLI